MPIVLLNIKRVIMNREKLLKELHELGVGYTTIKDFENDDMGLGNKFTYNDLLNLPIEDLQDFYNDIKQKETKQ